MTYLHITLALLLALTVLLQIEILLVRKELKKQIRKESLSLIVSVASFFNEAFPAEFKKKIIDNLFKTNDKRK